MKFSKLEQEVIINLCEWASKPNMFNATRNFLSEKGLCKGTGLFSFSKEIEERPQTILCIDTEVNNCDYVTIYNQTLFILNFLRKLERLGFVTISEGCYSEEKEYAIATFVDASIIGIRKTSCETQWSYSFTYLKKGLQPIKLELIEDGLTIRQTSNQIALPYHNMELFTRFETFDLVGSSIALEQDLFELVKNEFKTIEELMLEKAEQQLCTANKIFEKTQILANKAIENIELSKEQFEAELRNSTKQTKSASLRSYIAIGLAILSIIASPIVAKYVPMTIDNNQYNHIDSIQTEELKLLQDINSHAVEQDTMIINKIK